MPVRLVDFDGQVGGVGHIAEKLLAAQAQLAEWASARATTFLLVQERRIMNVCWPPPPAGISVLVAVSVGELCQNQGIALPLGALAADTDGPDLGHRRLCLAIENARRSSRRY